jgi:hypothetical protein
VLCYDQRAIEVVMEAQGGAARGDSNGESMDVLEIMAHRQFALRLRNDQ